MYSSDQSEIRLLINKHAQKKSNYSNQHLIYNVMPFNKKKDEFYQRNWQQDVLFTVAPFFKEINNDESFHVQRRLSLWSLLTAASRTFSLPESLYISTPWFVLSCCCKPMFNSFVNIFSKTCFTSHIHLYVSLGLLFSATKYLMTDLCSSLEQSVWFSGILNSLKTNITISWFLTMQRFRFWKKFKKHF